MTTRRDFLRTAAGATAGLAMAGIAPQVLGQGKGKDKNKDEPPAGPPPLFGISLVEYSLHRMILEEKDSKKKLDHLKFPAFAKKQFEIDAVEYWNTPFFAQGGNTAYLRGMKKQADDAGVKGLLILIDDEGHLDDADERKRKTAVDRHKRWIDAAAILGCHSIRVNIAFPFKGTADAHIPNAIDGLHQLGEIAAKSKINVLVENHGGLSYDAGRIAAVISAVDLDNIGTLPDFGNWPKGVDRYESVRQLIGYAEGLSAKSHDFDKDGNETSTDFEKMMRLVIDAGYRKYVGIEYEGTKLSEVEGIKATKKLLEKVRDKIAPPAP